MGRVRRLRVCIRSRSQLPDTPPHVTFSLSRRLTGTNTYNTIQKNRGLLWRAGAAPRGEPRRHRYRRRERRVANGHCAQARARDAQERRGQVTRHAAQARREVRRRCGRHLHGARIPRAQVHAGRGPRRGQRADLHYGKTVPLRIPISKRLKMHEPLQVLAVNSGTQAEQHSELHAGMKLLSIAEESTAGVSDTINLSCKSRCFRWLRTT